jgi:competence protein ComEA
MKQKMVVVILCMVCGSFLLFPKGEEKPWIESGKPVISIIKVEIKGAVEFPGVYHLFEPMTIGDALQWAGRIDEGADLTDIHLSEMITKDTQIMILDEKKDDQIVIVKINVNQASFKELITIPGMTETRAASLIIYREAHGDFKHLDELLLVKYIGVVTLEKIKPYLTL